MKSARQARLAAGCSSRRWGMSQRSGDGILIHEIGVSRGTSACRSQLGQQSTYSVEKLGAKLPGATPSSRF